MCEKCIPLIKCPIGEKRVMVIHSYKESEDRFSDAVMVVDKSTPDVTDVYITTRIGLRNSYSNIPFDIAFCPFCGQYLRL